MTFENKGPSGITHDYNNKRYPLTAEQRRRKFKAKIEELERQSALDRFNRTLDELSEAARAARETGGES